MVNKYRGGRPRTVGKSARPGNAPVLRPLKNLQMLGIGERLFLDAAEHGDKPTVQALLEEPPTDFHVNCTDLLGRTALEIAVDNENLEIIELLLSQRDIKIGNALLHAIREGVYKMVEMLIDHPTITSEMLGDGWRASLDRNDAENFEYSADISPIMLAAHLDQFEILQLLLSRGAYIYRPHIAACPCAQCKEDRTSDSLQHSLKRIYTFRALASPAWISLTSGDPILTAFKLSWELQRLSHTECEFKDAYLHLSEQCKSYAVDLLSQCRSTEEVIAILNRGDLVNDNQDVWTPRLSLERLKMAIKYEQKQFVSHPHCQQLLTSIWFQGFPGRRESGSFVNIFMTILLAFVWPFVAVIYIVYPKSRIGQMVKSPYMKFLYYSTSFSCFLLLLTMAAFEDYRLKNDDKATKRSMNRGPAPSFVEMLIIIWVFGMLWSEMKQLWDEGLAKYLHQWWNLLDFIMISLYLCTFSLRCISYYQFNCKYANLAIVPRQDWSSDEPVLISESLFAIANVFSFARIIYLFQTSPYLGPLQISLGCMLIDIGKFFVIFILVLTSFAIGLVQLYWYYARSSYCKDDSTNCKKAFSSISNSYTTLLWSLFSITKPEDTDVTEDHYFTQLAGRGMYIAYHYVHNNPSNFLVPYAVNVGVFTLTNIPFTCLDIWGCPKRFQKYKIQCNKDHPDLWTKLPRHLSIALFNVYVIGFFLYVLTYFVRKWNGYVPPKSLPTTMNFLTDAAICIVAEEIAFYYSHRLFHRPFFYKLIHKQHHEWTSPISLASRYCHPIEHALSYDGPVLLGPMLTNAHTVTTLIWYITGVFTSVCHHSGYKIPCIPSPEFHDTHHETFNSNFGILGPLDIIHGTETFYSSRSSSTKKSFTNGKAMISEQRSTEKGAELNGPTEVGSTPPAKTTLAKLVKPPEKFVYDKESMLKIYLNPASKVRPDYLSEEFDESTTNEPGVSAKLWKPDLWIQSLWAKEKQVSSNASSCNSSTSNQNSASYRSSRYTNQRMANASSDGTSMPNKRVDRLKTENKDGIVLSPQRRSFVGGCQAPTSSANNSNNNSTNGGGTFTNISTTHVTNTLAATGTAKAQTRDPRSCSPNSSGGGHARYNSGGSDAGCAASSSQPAAIASTTIYNSRRHAPPHEPNISRATTANRLSGYSNRVENWRDRSSRNYAETYNRSQQSRRWVPTGEKSASSSDGYGGRRNYYDLPEWATDGPVDVHDVIELCGFEDESQKDDDKSTSSRTAKQPADSNATCSWYDARSVENTTDTFKTAMANSNQTSPNDVTKNTTAGSSSVSETLNDLRMTTASENCDKITDIPSGSRFSKFFGKSTTSAPRSNENVVKSNSKEPFLKSDNVLSTYLLPPTADSRAARVGPNAESMPAGAVCLEELEAILCQKTRPPSEIKNSSNLISKLTSSNDSSGKQLLLQDLFKSATTVATSSNQSVIDVPPPSMSDLMPISDGLEIPSHLTGTRQAKFPPGKTNPLSDPDQQQRLLEALHKLKLQEKMDSLEELSATSDVRKAGISPSFVNQQMSSSSITGNVQHSIGGASLPTTTGLPASSLPAQAMPHHFPYLFNQQLLAQQAVLQNVALSQNKFSPISSENLIAAAAAAAAVHNPAAFGAGSLSAQALPPHFPYLFNQQLLAQQAVLRNVALSQNKFSPAAAAASAAVHNAAAFGAGSSIPAQAMPPHFPYLFNQQLLAQQAALQNAALSQNKFSPAAAAVHNPAAFGGAGTQLGNALAGPSSAIPTFVGCQPTVTMTGGQQPGRLSQQELQLTAQLAYQKALLNKKLEEQKENYLKKQLMQQQKINETLLTGLLQQQTVPDNSAAVAAAVNKPSFSPFTPTSVLKQIHSGGISGNAARQPIMSLTGDVGLGKDDSSGSSFSPQDRAMQQFRDGPF